MRTLTVTTFTTLDGVVQGPGGPDEDRDDGFEHGGWAVPHIDQEVLDFMTGQATRTDAFLLGRRTYDIFAATWPLAEPDDPTGSAMNGRPKYVASRTRRTLGWANSSQLDADTVRAVTELKHGDGGEIQVHGSGDLVQTLVEHDLVDEFQLLVCPVLLGSGKRLFGAGTVPAGLRLLSSRTTGSGVVIARYARDGKVGYGAMGPETGNW
jgi:dihydrofolate reductase